MYGRVWIRLAAAIAFLTAFGALAGGRAVPSGRMVACPATVGVVVVVPVIGDPGGRPPVSGCAEALTSPTPTTISAASSVSAGLRTDALELTPIRFDQSRRERERDLAFFRRRDTLPASPS